MCSAKPFHGLADRFSVVALADQVASGQIDVGSQLSEQTKLNNKQHNQHKQPAQADTSNMLTIRGIATTTPTSIHPTLAATHDHRVAGITITVPTVGQNTRPSEACRRSNRIPSRPAAVLAAPYPPANTKPPCNRRRTKPTVGSKGKRKTAASTAYHGEVSGSRASHRPRLTSATHTAGTLACSFARTHTCECIPAIPSACLPCPSPAFCFGCLLPCCCAPYWLWHRVRTSRQTRHQSATCDERPRLRR
ncbi:hypothetical protein BC831DRAFT_223758 [Entophlyctis helioformis]|nr:hypothetical protein BC831DRAFT_223758 [Entophlyctis helioformis]